MPPDSTPHTSPLREQDRLPAISTRFQTWLRPHLWPLALLAANRVGLFLLVYFSLILLPLNPNVQGFRIFEQNLFLDGWARWDTGWYLDIAENGYSDETRFEAQRNVVFFPLYPLLIRGINTIIQNSGWSGLLISNLSLLLAFPWLYQLIKRQYGVRAAQWAAILLICHPFSFFFNAIYSESLFLLLVVAAFAFGHRQQWGWAALAAAGASATRLAGIMLAPTLLLLYLHSIGYHRARVRRDILWLLLAPLGTVIYSVYLWMRFGAPLLFVTARNVYGWEDESWIMILHSLGAASSWQALRSGTYPALDLLNFAIGMLALLMVILARRQLHPAHTFWAVAGVVMALLGGGWDSLGRYILPLFPTAIAVPLIMTDDRKLAAVAYLFTLFLALFAILFSHWHFVS